MIGAVWVLFPGAVLASGSYLPRPPQPPARVIEDSSRYELGKAIFAGNANLTVQPKADKVTQRHRLAELQEKLPARVRKTVDLPSLAGMLTSVQLSALEYFLKVRHKIT